MTSKMYHTKMVLSVKLKKLILSSSSLWIWQQTERSKSLSPYIPHDINTCSDTEDVAVAGGVLAAKPSLKPAMELVEKSQNDSLVVFCSTSATNELVTWADPKGKNILSTAGR